MAAGVFDIFTVGVGPSSSHTVGPMRAANDLLDRLSSDGPGVSGLTLADVVSLRVELFGSLGATGKGHGTDRAVIAALAGLSPEAATPEEIDQLNDAVAASHRLTLGSTESTTIDFDPERDIVFLPSERLPYHPNALRFVLADKTGRRAEAVFYSVGGGFVVADDGTGNPVRDEAAPVTLPYPFTTGADLLARCADSGLSIAELMLRDEVARGRTRQQVADGLLALWHVMDECISTGCQTEGLLPGPFKVRRRAPGLLRRLKHRSAADPMVFLDWVSLWALAVNEQNAAGGRIVTAPTNGSAGIMPAVVKYVLTFLPGSDDQTIADFLLTAAAIGSIYQATASISGAEVGCQGEIGVASSMAAAGLCQVLGGSSEQIVNAAEIGMEHHLGLTCDPVGGLVQVPCIERNAVGATTAITAARLALAGDGRQIVSLDEVIATMLATGRDMSAKYKETSAGGLAVNLVAC